MSKYSNYCAKNNGLIYGSELSSIIETVFALAHEIEHVNQESKKVNGFDSETLLLNVLDKYPALKLRGMNITSFNEHLDNIYRKYYDIVPKERLANFYASVRLYLIGLYNNNELLKNDGLRRMYKSILIGYGMGEKCNSNININGEEVFAPSIKYISELLCISEVESKEIFDKYLRFLDEDEKLKLGLIVDNKHLDNSKSLYNRLSM